MKMYKLMDESNESSYSDIVSHTLFDLLKEMPKDIRKSFFQQTKGNTRPQKYLFFLSQLPTPMYWYVLGFIALDEAHEINNVGKVLYLLHIKNKLETTVDFDSLSIRQQGIYRSVLDQIEQKKYQFNSFQMLRNLDISEDDIQNLYPTVKEILTYMAQTDFDRYESLLLRFQKPYFKVVDYFECLFKSIVDMQQAESEIDLRDVLEQHSCVVKGDVMATAISRLEFTGAILSFLEKKETLSENIIKAKVYWNRLTDYYFNLSLNMFSHLPENTQYPEIKRNVKQMSNSFKTFFLSPDCVKSVHILMPYLLTTIRQCLIETAKTPIDKLYRSIWFEKKVGLTIAMEQKVVNNPIFDKDLSGLNKLFKIFQTAHEEKKEKEKVALNTSQFKMKIPTSYEEALVHFNFLKRTYYDGKEQHLPEIDKAVLGCMSDHELLYLMGVLSLSEYNRCCHSCEMIQYSEESSAIRESNISEIFSYLLDQSPAVILPLKKEHVDVMKQLRLAGSLYDRLYLDDCVTTRIDLSEKNPFSNMSDFKENPLRAEGLLLEDMILLMHSVYPQPVQTSHLIKRILSSYWEESTATLTQLHEQAIPPEMRMRMNANKALFGLNESEKRSTLVQRISAYKLFFFQMRDHILLKYESCPPLRLAVVKRFDSYINPFVKTWTNAKKCAKKGIQIDSSLNQGHQNA